MQKKSNTTKPLDLDTALRVFATKSDLSKTVKKTERVLRAEILRVEERLEGVEDKLSAKIEGVEDKLSAKIDNVLTAISNFAGRVENLETENEIGADQIHKLRDDVKNHDKRLAKLESAN